MATPAFLDVTIVRQRTANAWATSKLHTSSRISSDLGCCSEITWMEKHTYTGTYIIHGMSEGK